MSIKQPAIYLMSNRRNGAIYSGVTSDLIKRVYNHRNKIYDGFTADNDCVNLVYYEQFGTMELAIYREKQIKGGSRKKKMQLIEKDNPDWLDLYETLF